MVQGLADTLLATFRDVFAVSAVLVGFQLFVLRQPIPHLKKLVVGFGFVVFGLASFLMGLEMALFPLGKIMAAQLASSEFVFGDRLAPESPAWWSYGWVYVFGAAIGFSTTFAEPALIAVAYKAHQISGGTISQWGLRLVVAIGVAIGIALGTLRIVTGTPLFLFIGVGYVIVVVQTIFAPRAILPLAYDSGGVTTSTVTVPLVAALGLGLSASIPGRNPAVDGFGLIALASLFPIITVMGYAQLAGAWARRRTRSHKER